MIMKVRGKIKKPNFILTYCGCFVIVAAFLALIGALIYGHFAGIYGEEAMRMAAREESAMRQNMTAALNKKEVTSQDIAKLRQQVLWHYSETGQRYEIYYGQKKIIDASRTVIFHYSPDAEGTDDPQLYFFELADAKYLKYFDTPEVQKYKAVVPVDIYSDGFAFNPKFDEQPVIAIGINEAYINYETGKFIPVTCTIYDFSPNRDPDILGSVTVTIPVDKNSPELKGYTYIKSNGTDRFGGSIEGYEGPTDEPYSTALSTNDYGVYYGFTCTQITIKSFDEAFKTPVLAGNIILVALMFILTLIPTAFVYNIRKRNYEIFEYRRKTTDAMAHDLKTPMAAILSYAENLENHTGTDKQEFYVSKISEKVWQMNKMVNNMLDFSRGENASVTVKKSPVDIGSVLADAIASNEHEITKRGLMVSYEKAEVTVNTDKELFAQAIGNLINNAALYAKESSSIDIVCEPGKIVITNVSAAAVEDAEALKKPFAKGDESRKNYGSGLGLAIAENNLVLLGFKLDVKSEGDKFVVTVRL